ncbi:lytic murein transglycosylase [Alteromonas sp. V450]|uniref:transglycosylase SLT domain-containing protein n=1 Tax=Alteromonas sp. V450 TaxID=1912139 RepID=UPI0008FF28E0|nr:transglycosylase SLT domain-containing protein [Alteromonas sp. V450]OJF70360.1 lytic murein transglycosylase [Alteromonas sp. V450]
MSGFHISSWLEQHLSVNKNSIVSVLVSLVGAFFCSAAGATQHLTLPTDIFEKERARYLEVEKKLQTYSTRSVQHLDNDIHELANYPLYPYLLRLKLERTMSLKTKRDVEQFLNDFSGQPVSYGVRYKWLNYLAKNNFRDTFLASYRPGMGARLTCIALNYRLKEGEDEKVILPEVDALWLNGQSQPDECDPLFAKWKKAGLMTSEMVIKRIEIAAKEGNRGIISYLKRQLPREQQYLADAWLSVTRDASRVSKSALFPLKSTAHEAEVIVWAIKKLAWRNPDLAAKVFTRYHAKNVFSKAQLHDMKRAIALSYTLDRLPQADHWLELADVDGASEDVKFWHISHLLRKKQWQQVIDVIDNAPDELRREESYRYWKARALEALGQTMQATVLYKALAQERHYYGFMASAQIGEIPSLAHAPAPRDTAAIASVAKTPATMRAVEFFRLDRATEARREWFYLLSHLPESKVTDAGILAYEWGLYDQAITSFAQSGYWDDVERRFPLAFSDVFSEKSQAYSISKSLAMAIARRESSFRSDAISSVGATGLMQLMPGTAQYVAKRKVSRNTLFKVDDNVEYGVQYLRYLMDKLNNNPVLVSASYNAGWRKVLEWLPENDALPVDIWIENIPYKETRAYVKAVMAYQHIYDQQLGGEDNIFPQLTQDVIPSVDAVSTHPVTGLIQLAPR